MTPTKKLKLLKQLIDEDNYPVFEDSYLHSLLSYDKDILDIAIDLCKRKAAIPDIKLGDVEIKSSKEYFFNLAKSYRNKYFDEDAGEIRKHSLKGRVVKRYDCRD